jgi:hypothetical protein
VLALLLINTAPAAQHGQRPARLVRTVTVTPVRPWHPGDQVWTTSPPPSGLSVTATGCQRVPSSGYIGHLAYAQTSVEYSNYWDWSVASSAESFSWYVKTSGGTIVSHGTSSGGAGSASVGANILYWQVQNTGVDPQAWTVCFDVH